MAARSATISKVLTAFKGLFPPGFRAKFTITVENGEVRRDNVAVELREQGRQ
jgi:hypothetical protein